MELYSRSKSENLKLFFNYSLMTAANKQKAGDVTGRNNALKSGVYYMNSSIKHTNKMIEYLNVYAGKSKTSTSNSNTGKSKTSTSNTGKSKTTDAGSGPIVGNSNTKVYHNAGCRYVPIIKPEHLHYFKSRKEAEANGYRACKVCGG